MDQTKPYLPDGCLILSHNNTDVTSESVFPKHVEALAAQKAREEEEKKSVIYSLYTFIGSR